MPVARLAVRRKRATFPFQVFPPRNEGEDVNDFNGARGRGGQVLGYAGKVAADKNTNVGPVRRDSRGGTPGRSPGAADRPVVPKTVAGDREPL